MTGTAILGGIRYRVDSHERMVTFVELDRMTCCRITVTKQDDHALLYVASSGHFGSVPCCHLAKAVAIAADVLGPDHFPSWKAKHRFERNNALRRLFARPTIRWLCKMFWEIEVVWRLQRIPFAARHQWRLWTHRPVGHVTWEAAEAAEQ